MADQVVCDYCYQVISQRARDDGEMFHVYVTLGWGHGDGRWREYHRRCARSLTLADVYNTEGFKPL